MKIKNRTFVFRWLSFATVTLLSSSTWGNFEFSPISMQMTTVGKSSAFLAKVVNKDSVEIPIVIRVLERTMNENGEEKRSTTSELEVFPQQFILGPKEEKFVKILWKGPQELPHEKAFRVLVEHLPVDLTPSNRGMGSLRIMINYSAMVYVASQAGNPEVVLSSVEKTSTKRKLAVALENKGDIHSIISNPEINLVCEKTEESERPDKSSDKPDKPEALAVVLKKAALANLEGKNMLAKSKLKASINIPTTLDHCSKFKWSFRYSLQ